MSEQQTQTVTTNDRLERLRAKYKVQMPATTPREAVHQSFDARTYHDDKAAMQRLSKKPELKAGETATGAIHAEFAGLNYDLADLTDQYGQLNVNFSNLLGAKRIYGPLTALKIAVYETFGKKEAAKGMKIAAAQRRGDALEILVNKMAEVLQDQHQKAIAGREQSKGLQVENVAHIKTLDRKFIECLRGGHYTGADLAAAEIEAKKLETELTDIDDALGAYEKEVNAAKAAGDATKVHDITEKMCEVLDMKYAVLDGKLAAEGVVSEIRRQLLDSAEGVQSTKGATAQSKVNYQAINALIDAMSELEIKYRHALEDMVPVFRIQSKIAATGLGALEVRDTLVKTAKISERLMEANERLVLHLARETFELLKTPLYDTEKAHAAEARIQTAMGELNAQKKAWAEYQQSIESTRTKPHYAKPE